ncbi:MAG TPA: ABC transporter ATP-binding protein [Nitrospiria bacterium]|nr:ABC transporter ATP-binding protein [Nitrospiria bacterium]
MTTASDRAPVSTDGPVVSPAVAVEAVELTKRFGETLAVDHVSFRIAPGEVVGLLGPNGAGKTTILQMLLGTLLPTSGVIRILGLDLTRHRETILHQVNFSSTYVSMPASLTVRENLMVFARLYGLQHPKERVEAVMKLFEIADLRSASGRGLSSGQLTRVCLAKAFLNNPRVLFLDEPTASLDPDIADKTRRLLRESRDQNGTTILYTSHNMQEMEELCDRIIFLHKGRIIAMDTPKAVLAKYGQANLEELFLLIARQGVAP